MMNPTRGYPPMMSVATAMAHARSRGHGLDRRTPAEFAEDHKREREREREVVTRLVTDAQARAARVDAPEGAQRRIGLRYCTADMKAPLAARAFVWPTSGIVHDQPGRPGLHAFFFTERELRSESLPASLDALTNGTMSRAPGARWLVVRPIGPVTGRRFRSAEVLFVGTAEEAIARALVELTGDPRIE